MVIKGTRKKRRMIWRKRREKGLGVFLCFMLLFIDKYSPVSSNAVSTPIFPKFFSTAFRLHKNIPTGQKMICELASECVTFATNQ